MGDPQRRLADLISDLWWRGQRRGNDPAAAVAGQTTPTERKARTLADELRDLWAAEPRQMQRGG